MFTLEKTLIIEKNITKKSADLPKPAFFLDIETTGLSAQRNFIYCVGTACRIPENKWLIRQFFAGTRAEEPALLQALNSYLEKSPGTIITYNGTTFDLPFLEKRCRHYGLCFAGTALPKLDLYREAKELKALLSLPRLRQKDIEAFFGIRREDRYDGGRLIDVYFAYEGTQDPDLLKLLVLHNFEDMAGMIKILPLLSYRDLRDGAFRIRDITFDTADTNDPVSRKKADSIPPTLPETGEQAVRGEVSFLLSYDLLPRPVYHTADRGKILLKESSGMIKLPLIYRTLYYYLPDCKNYYYLPAEDTVIHKSIGRFTESAYREPATKDNCRLRKTGWFLPARKSDAFTCFQAGRSDTDIFWSLDELSAPAGAPGVKREKLHNTENSADAGCDFLTEEKADAVRQLLTFFLRSIR